MLDIRKMPKVEGELVLNKVLFMATDRNTNIRFDDEDAEWTVHVQMSDGSRFNGHGRGTVNDGVMSCLYLEYYPPRGGNIRFDLKVSRDNATEVDISIINRFNALLIKHGGSGKTFVNQFEDLEIYKPQSVVFEGEYITAQAAIKRNLLQKLGLFLMRLGN